MAKREKKVRRHTRKVEALKKCNRCHKTKELTEFYHDRRKSDGLSSKCKKCEYECRKVRFERLQNRTPNKIPNIDSKRCSKCDEVKPVADFYSSTRNSDGYSCHCKLCVQKQKKFYHRRLAARSQSEIQSIESKRCPKCGEVKPVSEFYKGAGKVDGYATHCKDCIRSSAAEYRKKISDRDFADIQVTGKKKCCMCGKNLPVSEFNYCRGTVEGLTSHCREYGKEYKRKHYEKYSGDYYTRTRQYRREKPERYRAYNIVQEAIKNGELTRPNICSNCGNSGYIVAHHDDYNRALDVVWICLSCDRQLHADLKRKEKGGH